MELIVVIFPIFLFNKSISVDDYMRTSLNKPNDLLTDGFHDKNFSHQLVGANMDLFYDLP